MKTAIPSLNGTLHASFSAAREFTVVDGKGTDLTIDVLQAQADDTIALVKILADMGVKRILAALVEDDAVGYCEQAGMQVFHGASGTVSDALNLIRLGVLDSLVNDSGCGCSGSSCSSKESSCGSSCCGH